MTVPASPPRIAHFALDTDDLYAMEQFYRSVFGFRLRYRYASARQAGMRLVFLEGGNAELELLQRPGGRANEMRGGHVAFHADDVDAAFAHALSLGAICLEEPRDTGDGFRECALADPEGNRIELARRIREFVPPAVAGVLFDLDGTLIDSEPNYFEADRRLFASFGVDLTPEMKRRYVGIGNTAMIRILRQRYNVTKSEEELLEFKRIHYLELARRRTLPFPKMVSLVRRLQQRGILLAVASGSGLAIIEELLTMTGLRDAFTVLVSADEVPASKPAPDIFLEAARRLGVTLSQAVVVEDSAPGVEAGVRAGMRVVAVPGFPGPDLDPAYGMADLLFEGGMDAFDPEATFRWICPA